MPSDSAGAAALEGRRVPVAAAGPDAHDLARSVLLVSCILGLTVSCLWILRPFLTALVCATTIAISTWPLLTGLQRRLGGRRGPGAPHVGLLAIVVLVSCLAQAGPVPALLLPVGWLYVRGAVIPASGLLAWALVVHVSGPIVRPLLIKRGVDLPVVLIISGVIGGVMAFGAVGLFIGPVLLAVASSLLESWMAEADDPTAETAGSGSAGEV